MGYIFSFCKNVENMREIVCNVSKKSDIIVTIFNKGIKGMLWLI